MKLRCWWLLLLLAVPSRVAAQEQPHPSEPPAPPEAAAADDAADDAADLAKQSCLQAFTRAQELRRAGELLSSREELIRCANAECPEILRNACVPWLSEVRVQIPSVVLSARSPRGTPVSDVSVYVDGGLAASKLDGLPIELDPGEHELRFEYGNLPSVVKRVVLPQGAKSYQVEAAFATARVTWDSPSDITTPRLRPEPPPLVPTLAWVGIGVAGTAMVVGTVTGAIALARADTLQAECNSTVGCGVEELDEAQAIADASTVSFAIAGAGAITALVALLVSWPSSPPASAFGPEGLRLRF